jgi:hypothetical protein
VLLISSAGSESLDLKNTRQIHIMEPFWHESKIYQVIGRAIRFKSHETLPKKDRHVDVYRWISIFPKQIKNPSADQYLVNISIKKQKLWDKYQQIIVGASIENNFFAKKKKNNQLTNISNNKESGLSDNDFTEYYNKYLKYKSKYDKLTKIINI